MTKVIELIITERKCGKGTSEDPIRYNKQLFTLGGDLVAEQDFEESGNNWLALQEIR